MTFQAKNFDQLTVRELYEILRSRSEVFILEQNIHCQDMDGVDCHSRHCFLEQDGRVVAYLRAFYPEDEPDTVYIGRVLTLKHRCGWGKQLMEYSMADLREHLPAAKIRLHSQKHAEGFYEKCGFYPVGDEFLEEGIPHILMERPL